MALFAIHCLDKPGAAALRAATRDEHLGYLGGLGSRVFAAGPLLGPDDGPIGTLLIVECDDRRGAYAVAAADPYALAGLFASVAVTGWRRVLPQP